MIHKHSISALKEIYRDGTKASRQGVIYRIIENSPWPLSDWDILQRLKPGSDNLNLVRPRITELHEARILKEGTPVKSHYKENMNVRTSRLVNQENQTSLF